MIAAAATMGAPRGGAVRRVLLRSLLTLIPFLAAVALAVWLTGLDQVRLAAASLSGLVFTACLGLAFLNYVLRGIRWLIFARALGIAVPAGRQLLYYFAGFALTVTPGKVGEAIRLWLLRREHVDYGHTLPLLIGDRVLDMAGVSLLAVFGAIATARSLGLVLVAALPTLLLVGMLLRPQLAVALLEWTYARTRRFPRLFVRGRRALLLLPRIAAPGVLLPALLLSVVGWSMECLVLWVVLHDLGAVTTVVESVIIFSLSTIAGAVSMLPGGLGSTDLSMLGLLRLVDVPEAAAIVTTIAVRLATLWFSVICGIVALPLALMLPVPLARATRLPA